MRALQQNLEKVESFICSVHTELKPCRRNQDAGGIEGWGIERGVSLIDGVGKPRDCSTRFNADTWL